jgi:hypothetical protein
MGTEKFIYQFCNLLMRVNYGIILKLALEKLKALEKTSLA